MKVITPKPLYWSGEIGLFDDYGNPYTDVMYDAKIKNGHGAWACMSELSWSRYGAGVLGIGYGQKYQKQTDGRWLCIEGNEYR